MNNLDLFRQGNMKNFQNPPFQAISPIIKDQRKVHKYFLAKKNIQSQQLLQEKQQQTIDISKVNQLSKLSFGENEPIFEHIEYDRSIEDKFSQQNTPSCKRKNSIDLNLEQEEDTQKKKNIFYHLDKYKSSIDSTGPKFDPKGKIIKYSIVGKPEWFLKNNQKLEGLQNNRNKKMIVQNSDKNSCQSRSAIKQPSLIKHQKNQELKITKNQCEKEIQVIRQRIKDNIEAERQQLFKLPFSNQLQETNQQRIIRSHSKQEANWLQFIEDSSLKLGRDSDKSLVTLIQNYRIKKEAVEVLDVLNNEYDLYGPRVWYNTLRNYNLPVSLKEQQNINQINFNQNSKTSFLPQFQIQDLPYAFTHSQITGKKKELEFVRKPYQMLDQSKSIMKSSNNFFGQSSSNINKMNRSQSLFSLSSLTPFNNFKADDYYQQRINQIQNQMNENQVSFYNQFHEFDNLAVIGQNQFEKEADMILKECDENTLYIQKKENQEQEKIANEIIDQKYSKQVIVDMQRIEKLKQQNVTQNKKDKKALSEDPQIKSDEISVSNNNKNESHLE